MNAGFIRFDSEAVTGHGMPPMAMERFFHDWKQPALTQAVSVLTDAAGAGHVLDLRQVRVVVPTRHAGRRLREALAAGAAERGGAVLPGDIVTPDRLTEPSCCATPVQETAAWLKTLDTVDAAELAALLPDPSVLNSFSARLGLIERVTRLRGLLCEENVSIAEVPLRYPAHPEPDRWSALALLESVYLEGLSAVGLLDRCLERLRRARAPEPDPAVERVEVLFTPDLPPLAVCSLAGLARAGVSVRVHVLAPESEAVGFSEAGTPLPEVWTERHIPLSAEQVTVTAHAAECGLWIQRRVAALPETLRGALALAVPDSDLLPLLKNGFRQAGRAVFDPAGEPVGGHPLYLLTATLAAFAETPHFERAAALLRHPQVQAWLEREVAGFSAVTLLTELDRFQQRHLPLFFNLVELQAFCGAESRAPYRLLPACAERLQGLVEPLHQGAPVTLLPMVLGRLYAATAPEDHTFADAAAGLMQTVDELEAADWPSGMTDADRLLLLQSRWGASRIYNERRAEALDLLGWAELLWEDAPLLLLAGLHEGCVPESVTGDVFLPDAARAAMGLRDNRYLLARDVYILNAVLQTRGPEQVQGFISRVSRFNDPLKPSRLLFRCPNDELPARVQRFFGAPLPVELEVPRMDWVLRPPLEPVPARISVTAFRDYLDCPLRFYFKHVLGMEALDLRKAELDARDYGTVCHRVLQAFAAQPALRDSVDAGEIGDFMAAELDRLFRTQYGIELSAALLMQRESLIRRLRAAARTQAAERAAGWRIEEVELKIENLRLIEGVTLVGTVDRIDRHEDGRCRVLDYKTHDKSEKGGPVVKHLRRARADAPDWMRAPEGRQWTDLQLPLYLLLLERRDAECGYFILPRAESESGVQGWEGLTAEWLESALACAGEVVRRIQAREFKPSAWPLRHDDFKPLFYGAVEEVP